MIYKEVLTYLLLFNLISIAWFKPHFKPDRYCGDRLGAVVSLVCKGVYNAPVKKAFEDFYNDYETEDNKIVQTYPYYIPKALARALIPTMQRRNGIVDECCKKPCGWQELQAYCG